jgi:hypothetical protein
MYALSEMGDRSHRVFKRVMIVANLNKDAVSADLLIITAFLYGHISADAILLRIQCSG